eukprot:TRINITY_DN3752_c0_g2_i1.p1 TRINITY_DN3752_c0_g2~~TRINITY_DN3752_c0_g2_i1.p1  ORF type:complete len:410 (+),score=80.25 TRINITY_DN3752_c0_g2_i1:1021-2250(+)
MQQQDVTFNALKLCPDGFQPSEQSHNLSTIFLLCVSTNYLKIIYLSEDSEWKELSREDKSFEKKSSTECKARRSTYYNVNGILHFASLENCVSNKSYTSIARFEIESTPNGYQLKYIPDDASPVDIRSNPKNIKFCANSYFAVMLGDYGYMDQISLSNDEVVLITSSSTKTILSLNISSTESIRTSLVCGRTLEMDGSIKMFLHQINEKLVVIEITQNLNIIQTVYSDQLVLNYHCTLMTFDTYNIFLSCNSMSTSSVTILQILSNGTARAFIVFPQANAIQDLLSDSHYLYIGGGQMILSISAGNLMFVMISIQTQNVTFSLYSSYQVSTITKVGNEVWIGGYFRYPVILSPLTYAENLLRINIINQQLTLFSSCVSEKAVTKFRYDEKSSLLPDDFMSKRKLDHKRN